MKSKNNDLYELNEYIILTIHLYVNLIFSEKTITTYYSVIFTNSTSRLKKMIIFQIQISCCASGLRLNTCWTIDKSSHLKNNSKRKLDIVFILLIFILYTTHYGPK
jgi:hypothetical protein